MSLWALLIWQLPKFHSTQCYSILQPSLEFCSIFANNPQSTQVGFAEPHVEQRLEAQLTMVIQVESISVYNHASGYEYDNRPNSMTQSPVAN